MREKALLKDRWKIFLLESKLVFPTCLEGVGSSNAFQADHICGYIRSSVLILNLQLVFRRHLAAALFSAQ